MRAELEAYLLLLDTCGERGSLALAQKDTIVCEMLLEERAASAALLGGVRGMLQRVGLRVEDIAAVGVVNGPGSFTGLRVGLAVAKGLCEALKVPLTAVSRLAVLAAAGGQVDGLAVLRAGREEVYGRDGAAGQAGSERMMASRELVALAQGRPVVYAEDSLRELLAHVPAARQVTLTAGAALPLVRARLAEGIADPALLDANYVRHESEIYRRQKQDG